MHEAHDLIELKNLVSQLGLREDRRQSPRYNVDIAGSYYTASGESVTQWGRCRLIDVSKEGLSVQLNEGNMQAGMILHLELPKGDRKVGISSRIVHVEPEGASFIAGLQAIRHGADIVQQLLSI